MSFDGMAIAKSRIAEEAERRTGTLDLRNLGLERLPEELFGLVHLRGLDLGERDDDPHPNRIEAQQERFSSLVDLEILSIKGSDLESLDVLRRLPRLRQFDCSQTRVSSLSPVAELSNLELMNCSRAPVNDLSPLAGLICLQAVVFWGTKVNDLSPLAGLANLQTVDCNSTQVSDLSPLAGLANLQNIDCARTLISDLSPLVGLANLQSIDCSWTQVSDLAPLAGLANLQSINCTRTQVSDLSPLAGLANLQSIDCSWTQVSDLAPLAGLANLQTVHCPWTQVSDLSPLAGLASLQSINCARTQVSNFSPLAGLANLQTVHCPWTQVSDLSPLAGLANLQSINCSWTQVSNLSPLAGLANLQSIDCSWTQVTDLTPLAGLPDLRQIGCFECKLDSLPPFILDSPALESLIALQTHVDGLPHGILSHHYGDNCLDRVRAHFADLDAEAADLKDVKLLLLGNGRAGKTQIARWLSGQPFDEAWDSTHGIRIVGRPKTGSIAATLHLQMWDFGGQDIYHGTHAMFLRGPAVLMPVWAKGRENRDTYDHEGLTFRNHPLAYWLDVVRHQSSADNPVLIVQNQCDRKQDEALVLPVAPDVLDAFPHATPLRVSAKIPRGGAALEEALREAVEWLHDPARFGTAKIGAGRLRVQRRLEALREADMALPREARQNRLLEREAFDAICAKEGGVTSPALLLDYLDANGTVMYRSGFFGNRIVLDMGWALEAIYAVFDRKRVYKALQQTGGRFTADLLAVLIWQEHGQGERDILLGMMRACGMCFSHRRVGGVGGDEVEYIAPDLLPGRASIERSLAPLWDETRACETALFRHALLHGGLIRSIMSDIGEKAGVEALYWRGGLCAYETDTRSRLFVEEEMTGEWEGLIRVRTQDGQATVLLEKIITLIEHVQTRLAMRPLAVERSSPRLALPEPAPLKLGSESSTMPKWYVSYAWKDDLKPEGRMREDEVDRTCAAARANNKVILRDKEVLGFGDEISRFMKDIGTGDRIFVFMSDKYLRSPFCMFELSEVWRTSRQDKETFRDRVRLFALPDATIWKPTDWVDWAVHWKREHDDLDKRSREHGAAILGEIGQRRLIHMQRFYTQTADILAMLADTVQPRTFDDFLPYGFDDPPR